MRARIYVTLKSGVLDPQGQAVGKTLTRLGFSEVEDVRIGKYVEIEIGESDPKVAHDRVVAMCDRLIANTVIEDYRVEVEEGG